MYPIEAFFPPILPSEPDLDRRFRNEWESADRPTDRHDRLPSQANGNRILALLRGRAVSFVNY